MTNFSVLKKRSEFLAVASSGQKWVARGFILQMRPTDPVASPTGASLKNPPQKQAQKNEGGIRIGFTATKKIGGAVVRNRAKRRLRALAQEILGPQSKEGMDYVLIARIDTPTCPFEDLRRDLMMALKRLKLSRGAL